MAIATVRRADVNRIEVPAGAWCIVLTALAAMFLLLQSNGWVLAHSWDVIHEFFHDGRHFLGVPCH